MERWFQRHRKGERVCTNEIKSNKWKFCRWKCWCRSKTDGKGRIFSREAVKGWHGSMMFVGVTCGCGLVETEMHVLFECTLYGEERERWRGAVGDLKGWYGWTWNNKRVSCVKWWNRKRDNEIYERNVEQ